ncbi:MAG: RNA polymerase sigma-70 factor, ECF subfamily [Parcubacteria group bacterium Gr01-1014_70]|nr:MAG: RNA polymerase sigma-70 factor, ECF subfamily [Parcubacteria group bacterium Gr01-1014_70]
MSFIGKNRGTETSSMTGVADKEGQLLAAYDSYAEALFRHCYFRLYDREMAKDVLQDVFMRTWEYMVRGNTVDSMRAFLYRTANNLVVDTVRKQKPYSLDEWKEKGFDVKDESHDASRVTDIVSGREVLRVLDKLEDPYRAVVIMRYIDELMPREIAAVLGETENAVSVRIHRAVKKARQLWEGEIEVHEV